MSISTPTVQGKLIDNQTRCQHYHSPLDIIAIKFKCCNTYYACIHCHNEHVHHTTKLWPVAEYNEKAILCGHCNVQMSIYSYLTCQYKCPNCLANFNPGCSNHNHLYFEGFDV